MILSICIPAFERADVLKRTLDSIYSQHAAESLFEVCISDDSKSDAVEKMIKGYKKKNLRYQHKAYTSSYMNIENALSMGKGKFLKLINDYSKFAPGMLNQLIELIKEKKETRPLIIFLNGSSLTKKQLQFFYSADSFMQTAGYHVTWTICFGIWRDEYLAVKKSVSVNEMFPHVSYLFACLKRSSMFIIDNQILLINQELDKKGGYNISEVFGTIFVSLLEELYTDKIIHKHTYLKIKRQLLHFMAYFRKQTVCFPEKFYFSFQNEFYYLHRYYSFIDIGRYIIYSKILMLRHFIFMHLKSLNIRKAKI